MPVPGSAPTTTKARPSAWAAACSGRRFAIPRMCRASVPRTGLLPRSRVLFHSIQSSSSAGNAPRTASTTAAASSSVPGAVLSNEIAMPSSLPCAADKPPSHSGVPKRRYSPASSRRVTTKISTCAAQSRLRFWKRRYLLAEARPNRIICVKLSRLENSAASRTESAIRSTWPTVRAQPARYAWEACDAGQHQRGTTATAAGWPPTTLVNSALLRLLNVRGSPKSGQRRH